MTFWTTPARPTARKPHRCMACDRRIDPGETYVRGAGLDGTAWTWKWCAHCDAVVRVHDIESWADGISSDELADWAHDRSDSVAEARHKAGWHLRWRTRLGTLLPVPSADDLPPREPSRILPSLLRTG